MPRPKPPLSLWVIRNRKRLSQSTLDIAKAVDVAETTVRGWEAGRSISPDNQDALARYFGEQPPDRPTGGDADLVAALDRQTDAITSLVDRLDRMAVGQRESTDAILQAIAAAVGARVPRGRSGDSEPAALAGTAR